MARSNGELIAKARQMAEDAGRRPATVAGGTRAARDRRIREMSAAPPGMLKMSELARRSGVSAGTIKHYLREGLLCDGDPIVRTSRNMAYYPSAFVARIRADQTPPGGAVHAASRHPSAPA